MNEVKRRFLYNALKLFDLGLIVVSFGLATFLLVHADRSSSLRNFLAIRVKLSNCAIFSAVLLLCYGVFSLCGLYQSRRLSTGLAELMDVLKATTIATLCMALSAAIFSIVMITPRFLVLFWTISSISVAVFRVLLQYWLAWLRRHGRNLRYLLVLGTNARAIDFVRKIEAAPERGF